MDQRRPLRVKGVGLGRFSLGLVSEEDCVGLGAGWPRDLSIVRERASFRLERGLYSSHLGALGAGINSVKYCGVVAHHLHDGLCCILCMNVLQSGILYKSP